MSACKVYMPGGVNKDCSKFLKKLRMLLIVEAGTEFTTADLKLKATYTDEISTNLTMYALRLRNYNVTTDDPEVQTAGDGEKSVVQEFAPSLEAYGKLGPCDFKELLNTLDGGEFDVIPIDSEGNIMMTYVGDKSYGFSASVKAVQKGFADAGALADAFRIDVYFNDIEEFKQFNIVNPNFNPLTELFANMPMGYNITVNSYNGTNADVQLDKRCAEGTTGFDTAADWIVVETNASPAPTVTLVTDNGGGNYTVAVSLSAGEYALLQLRAPAATPFTSLSNIFQIEA